MSEGDKTINPQSYAENIVIAQPPISKLLLSLFWSSLTFVIYIIIFGLPVLLSSKNREFWTVITSSQSSIVLIPSVVLFMVSWGLSFFSLNHRRFSNALFHIILVPYLLSAIVGYYSSTRVNSEVPYFFYIPIFIYNLFSFIAPSVLPVLILARKGFSPNIGYKKAIASGTPIFLAMVLVLGLSISPKFFRELDDLKQFQQYQDELTENKKINLSTKFLKPTYLPSRVGALLREEDRAKYGVVWTYSCPDLKDKPSYGQVFNFKITQFSKMMYASIKVEDTGYMVSPPVGKYVTSELIINGKKAFYFEKVFPYEEYPTNSLVWESDNLILDIESGYTCEVSKEDLKKIAESMK